MQPRRTHPFFSRIGCGAALILALGLVAIVSARGGGLFSPGPLSAAGAETVAGNAESAYASHADFEGQCGLCHAPWQSVTAERCEGCHENVAGERETDTGLHGLLPETERCRSCHLEHKGRDGAITTLAADSFDHDVLTAFSLNHHQRDYDGGDITCTECHRPGAYAAAHVDCVTCHAAAAEAFMGEHRALFGDDCLACHDGVDQMAGFEHEQVYPLVGAHETVACAGCHLDHLFQGTPRACAECHEEPPVHAGLFGMDCARCHSPQQWTPAELTQHTFPLDHGDEGKIDCLVCHEERYITYTCYNCHEHEPVEVRAVHLEEGIADFDLCAKCHPTGQESELEESAGQRPETVALIQWQAVARNGGLRAKRGSK